MDKVKIAYIGIDLFAGNLPVLSELGCEIMEVFTCKTDNITEFNVEVCEFANKNNIPLKKERITLEDFERLHKNGCELVICAGYYYKIPIYSEIKLVNVHPSLLPNGRGAWPMPIAILESWEKTGVTLHKISEGFDEGDIILQGEVFISKNENLVSLTEKLCKKSCELLREFIPNYAQFCKKAVPQSEGKYLQYKDGEDFPITAEMDFAEADKILRAFYGYECFYIKNEQKFAIVFGEAVKDFSCTKCEFPILGGYIKVGKNY